MKYCLLLFSLFFCLSGFSQDVITTKSGEQIQCHILGLDSIKIIYRLRNESTRHEIKRIDVENYYLSKVTENELAWISRPMKEFLSIGFYGGLAYPIGDFASMNANSELSGLAFRGYFFNAELNFKLSQYVGLSLTYMNQKHALNYQAVSNYFNTISGTTNFTAGGGDWLISGLLFGLNFDVPIKTLEGLSFTAYVGAGVPKFTFPEQFVNQATPPFKGTLSESKTSSGAFKPGIGLRYKASKYIALHLNASYFSAHPAFFNIVRSYSNGYSEIVKYEQEIRCLNVQGGICFLFYRK